MVDISSRTQQKNLVMPTFINMPLYVANQVLEKMQPDDLMRARKVCRSLRNAVDKIGLRSGSINLSLMKNEVEMTFNGGLTIIYTAAANTSRIVARNKWAKKVYGEHYVERAVKDFKIISKHVRRVAIWRTTKDLRNVVSSLIEILSSEKCMLVEDIGLWSFSFDEILTILPFFDAKGLKKVELTELLSVDFEQITHLEHWKNAEEFVLWDSQIASTMIVHFFNFKFFHIHFLKEFPAQTAIQMRDDLLRRSTFQSCEIKFEKSKSNPIEIAKVFKPDYVGGNEFKIEFSNGNDKFDILLEYWSIDSEYFELEVIKL